jgi:hypothetical protein
MRVARWYCAKGQMTFSLLPDCMCARMGVSLDEAEQVVSMSEEIGVERAAMVLRVDAVQLPGALCAGFAVVVWACTRGCWLW